jgi:peptidoglycan/xylan/chitin deacetylase (PgdA/CDA1 family)
MERMDPRFITLTFHGIGDIDRPLDDGEGDVWIDRQLFGAVLDHVSGRADVRLTFDDGNASDVRHALPELERRKLRGTFFVVAERLGRPGFLSAGDVRALADAGMAIGSHGMRHVPWRHLPDERLHEELVEAKAQLEGVLDRPVTEASCPFGAYDRRVLRALRRCGYDRVYTSDGGTAHPDAWLQARTSIHSADRADAVLTTATASEAQPVARLQRHAKLAVKRWR